MIKVGQTNKDRKEKLVGYDLYRGGGGSGVAYIGRATSIREARRMARRIPGLPEHLWGTAYAAGGCGVYGDAPRLAPDEREEEEPCRYVGRRADVGLCRVWRRATA
jgi:hypothetical protein